MIFTHFGGDSGKYDAFEIIYITVPVWTISTF